MNIDTKEKRSQVRRLGGYNIGDVEEILDAYDQLQKQNQVYREALEKYAKIEQDRLLSITPARLSELVNKPHEDQVRILTAMVAAVPGIARQALAEGEK